MATFNTTAVNPGATFGNGAAVQIWQPASDPSSLIVATAPCPNNWQNSQDTVNSVGSSLITVVVPSQYGRTTYSEGFFDGEIFGFSSQQEEIMEPIQLGETDDDKKTISFRIYDTAGFPASGLTGEGAIASPGVGDIQTNRDLAGFVNATGTFSHILDGEYRYTFSNAEVAAGTEGNIYLRVAITGFRTVSLRVPIRDIVTSTKARDAVLNAVRSGFVGTGTIGEGIAIASSLLQGNFFMDQVTHGANGQTSARIRCFHTGAATTAATSGGSGEGEFATFVVTTAYAAPGQITTHRVVQQ